jgi:hypothetical protein
MKPVAHIAHMVLGRVRIRIPSRRGDAEYFASLQQSLIAFPAIVDLRANPNTGSLVIVHDDTSLLPLKEYAEENQLFILEEIDYKPEVVLQRASSGFETIDTRIKSLTGGDIDLRSALFLGLVAMSIRQLSQGNIMGPAATIFWQALGLVLSTKTGKK